MPKLRVGQGFDLHRLEAGIPFRLGGLTLDWPKGPRGHSDGDVVLHALTDALLGATGMGDIGEWFPPSNPQWKGADSAALLTHVLERLHEEGWRIENIDTTILLEIPTLAPHKPDMRDRIARLTGLEHNQVSIKAKTLEGLGPIGTNDAVAALVTVLLTKP